MHSRMCRCVHHGDPQAVVFAAVGNQQRSLQVSQQLTRILSLELQAIVTGIRNNNPGRPIPASSVRGFPTRDAANAYEVANPETVTGGLFFSRLSGGNIGFVLQSNSTVRAALRACFIPSCRAPKAEAQQCRLPCTGCGS